MTRRLIETLTHVRFILAAVAVYTHTHGHTYIPRLRCTEYVKALNVDHQNLRIIYITMQ